MGKFCRTRSMKKYFTCKIYKTIIWSKKVINIYKNSSDESKRQRLKHGSIKGGILGEFFEAQKWTIYNESGKEIQL